MDMLTHTQLILDTAWWFALGVCILFYVMLDGADLGAGIFSLFVKDHQERGAIMAAMAGTWDANETWLVVAGGVLFGTFPLVYGSTFHYLMVPLAFVLWGIMLRAVALEYRHHAAPEWQPFLDKVFGIASLTVTFFGGMSVGAALMGFPMSEEPGRVPTYIGGALTFISPFSIWVGISACVAVTLSGVLFVRARFEKDEPIRQDAARWTHAVLWLSFAVVAITVVWSMAIFPWARAKWFSGYFWFWALMALVGVFCVDQVRRATLRDSDFIAILWLNGAIAVFALELLLTMFPYLVPGTWTIWNAASPSVSLITFTLTMGGFLPVMIMYNVYQIWVFRTRISKLASYNG